MSRMIAQYPVVVEVPVAWGEMDAYGHVNNIVYFRYFETARIAYSKSWSIPILSTATLWVPFSPLHPAASGRRWPSRTMYPSAPASPVSTQTALSCSTRFSAIAFSGSPPKAMAWPSVSITAKTARPCFRPH